MNNLKIVQRILGIAYFLVFLIFICFLILLPNRYMQIEKDYIKNAEQSLVTALNETNNLDRKDTLNQLVLDFPMEIVVYNNNEVIYNTTKISNPTPAVVQNSINNTAKLLEKQGKFTTEDKSEFMYWFTLYKMPLEEVLMTGYFMWIIVFIVLLFLILLGFIGYIQWYFFKPLSNLKDSLTKLESNNLDAIEVQHDDVLNRKIKDFTTKVSLFSRNVLTDYANMEKDLEYANENLEANVLYSRALIHDLKTPIHELMMENEYKLKQSNDTDDVEVLEFNIYQSDSILQQLNNILQTLNTGLTKEQVEVKEFDLVDLVSKERQKFLTSLRQKELLFTIEQPESLFVISNYISMKLLVHNIISNAVTYSLPKSEIVFEILQEKDGFTIVCTNETNKTNIERFNKKTNFFQEYSVAKDHQDYRYSSGNGLYLIEELSSMLDGECSLSIEQENIVVKIVFKEFLDEESDV